MAPEYFLGEAGTQASDLFSLGVIAYQMLSNRLPYGANIARAGSRAAQRRLNYQSVLDARRSIPSWIDTTLRKAVHIEPLKRYQELSEFTWDLRNPNPQFVRQERPPLIERNPLAFWKGLSLVLFVLTLTLLFTHPLLDG
jgi:serine/threonine protein kinase